MLQSNTTRRQKLQKEVAYSAHNWGMVWDDKAVAELRHLLICGHTTREIAEKTGRTYYSIVHARQKFADKIFLG